MWMHNLNAHKSSSNVTTHELFKEFWLVYCISFCTYMHSLLLDPNFNQNDAPVIIESQLNGKSLGKQVNKIRKTGEETPKTQ